MLRVGPIPGIGFPLPVAAVAAGLVKNLGLNGFDPKQTLVAGNRGGEECPIPDLGHPAH
jgi:hypothetical protein